MRPLLGIVSLVAVLLLSQTAIAKDVTLSWDPSPTPQVTGYQVYVSLNPDMQSLLLSVDAGNVLTLMIQDLGDTYEHFFCVKAYDELGNSSVCSNVVKSPKVELQEGVLPELDFTIDVKIIP